MASVDSIISAIAPLLAADSNKSTFIELATAQTDACYFGTNYNLAIALRASHMYTLSKRNANESGSLSSKRMGPVSVSFANSTAQSGSSELNLTTYGKQLLSLIKTNGFGISVIGSSNGTIQGGC